jgi:hypothetical protein
MTIEGIANWIETRWSRWPVRPRRGSLAILQANDPDDADLFDLILFDRGSTPRLRVSVAAGCRRLPSRSLDALRALAASPTRGSDHDLLDAGDLGDVTVVVEEGREGANLPCEKGPPPSVPELRALVEWLARIHLHVPDADGFLQVGTLGTGRITRTQGGWRTLDWSRFGLSRDPRLDCLDVVALAGQIQNGALTATGLESCERHARLLGLRSTSAKSAPAVFAMSSAEGA